MTPKWTFNALTADWKRLCLLWNMIQTKTYISWNVMNVVMMCGWKMTRRPGNRPKRVFLVMRVARGVSRTVLITEKYAIKFPTWRGGGRGHFEMWCHGYIDNRWERMMSRSGCPGINPLLFKIGPVNFYRRCEPIMVGRDFDYDSIAKGFYGASDRKEENIGVHPTLGLVWIDY